MKKCCNVSCDEFTDNEYFDVERKIRLCEKCIEKLINLDRVNLRSVRDGGTTKR